MASGVHNLNKSIVIVNEFTIHGSRGSSPGRYVIEYMARDNGTENLTPTAARSEKVLGLEREMERTYRRESKHVGPAMSEYVTRYMARDTATEIAYLSGGTDTSGLRSDFEEIQGYAGRAFCRDDLSMPHKAVLGKAREIQAAFDAGKPVMKTVISFETQYLKDIGVLPGDLDVQQRGDLYGRSDQAKLRLAIQHGLSNISHEFSDLDYIGVIQVDTMHLHCHLAMVDKGPGKRFTKDGEQKGVLDAGMMSAMRRGIDNSLTQSKIFRPLSIQMEGERRNTIGYIRRFTHRVLEERGLPQYLLACLPKDDKSLWKASINTDGGPDFEMEIKRGKSTKKVRGNMKKANEIVRSYVVDLLNKPDSGFAEAMAARHAQLEAQKERGDFDAYYVYRSRGVGRNRKSVRVKLSREDAVRDQEEKFREEVTVRGMNAVYDVLKSVDDGAIRHHTPLLDAMGMPYEEMANYVKDDKLIEFGFRLRSYANRLDHHRNAYRKVNEVIHQYEDGEQATYNPESKVVYDFLKIEQEYNHALIDKYQTFLHFFHVKEEYQGDLDDVMALRHRASARRAMSRDKKLSSMEDLKEAERKGLEEYGLPGGSLLASNPELFRQQIEEDEKAYRRGLRDFSEKLAGIGMLFDPETGEVSRGLAHEFDQVKAYDLHHMSYDFTYDFRIASENVDRFAEMANRRYEAYRKAQAYLASTGQEDNLRAVVSPEDIEVMKSLADEYRSEGPTYKTKFDDAAQMRRNTATVRLDHEACGALSERSMMKSLQDILKEMQERPEPGNEGPGAVFLPGRRDLRDDFV